MSAPPPPSPAPLDDVLVEALVRYELDGDAGVAAVLAMHPEHRRAVQEHLARLRQLGLLAPPPNSPGAPSPGASPSAAPSLAGPFPERFGDFQLLRRLGGGGMGVVFLARQLSLSRTVALKLVRADHLLLPGTRERFRREVDAIARLQHPGIVPVFAAGEEQGMPWLAMEHVLGASLAEVLQRVRGRDPATLRGSDLYEAVLTTATERQPEAPRPSQTIPALFSGTWASTCLRIARATALALQHAHERGVLHRDVKPSNVMLTPDGRTLLLDFGLATAENHERLTGTGNQLGTPAYMSPEQMRGDSRSLDGRTDVYSLGVTLYELITLQIPFGGATTMAIRDQVLDGRAMPLRRHNRAAPRDTELVVHKAIDQDRGHRYGDIAAFATELDNLIELRPVSASPPSAMRIVRRWAQRHPARAFAAVAAVLLFLVAPSVFLLQQHAANRDIGAALQLAREQELEARRSRDAARVQRDLAREAVDTMLTRVAAEDLLLVPHLQQVRADLLGSARDFYERFLADGADDPELLEQAAKAALRVAFAESGLGRVHQANDAADRAADLAGQLCAREPASVVAHTLLANAQLSRGRALQQQAQADQAGTALAAARQHAALALQLQPEHAEALVHLLGCERSLAMLHGQAGMAARASEHWQAAVQLWHRHGATLQASKHAAAAIDHVIGACVDEATRRLEAGAADFAAAETALQEILGTLPKAALPPSGRLALARLAVARSGVAVGHGDVVDQERQLRACLQVCGELLAHNPDHAGALRIQAMAANELGMLLQRSTDRAAEGSAELERAAATLRRLIALDASVADNRANLAATLVNLGAGHRRRAEPALARTNFEEAVQLAQQCHDAAPDRADWTNYLFQALWFLGLCTGELGDHATEAVAARRIAALQPPSADTQFVAAELLSTAAAAAAPDRRGPLEEEAMLALRRAAELGCDATTALQDNDAFTALRRRPEFATVQSRFAANAAGK